MTEAQSLREVAEPTRSGADAARADSYAEIATAFDRYAAEEERWLRRTGGYHELVSRIARSLVPPGASVLEIGSGRGDMLAALRPSRGVGVDVSERMIATARERHPELEFRRVAGEDLDLGETFDYIVLTDLIPFVDDAVGLFEAVRRHCHPRTRVIVSFHSNVWRPILGLLRILGLRPNRPIRNWITPHDLVNICELAGLEVVTERKEILFPATIEPLSGLLNGWVGRVPGIRSLALTSWAIARPRPQSRGQMKMSVVVPCRNEQGTIRDLVERIPEVGAGTEIVFVDDGSTDETLATMEAEASRRPDRQIQIVELTGVGKWNAVQQGFDAATGDLLVIHDGDMTVDPEVLTRVYEALASGRTEFVNGNRLVYGMEPGAMRFLNMIGNKAFAALLSWTLGQYVKDTLCGTKAIMREDWEQIRSRREELGAVDPYGDFELLLGSALLGLKIADIPVRYRARAYGESKMRRWGVGGMFARLTLAGFRRLWVRPVWK